MNRRRILTVVDAIEAGGLASHLTGSMGRLARSRYDLRVANLGRATALSGQLRSMKIKVHDLGVEGRFSVPRRVPTVCTLPDPEPAAAGWRGRVQALLEKKTAVRCARLLAPSELLREHYSKVWGAPVELFPSFLDLPAFRERLGATSRAQVRLRLGVGPEDVVLLYVGRGHPGKGLERLMEAFQVTRVEHGQLRLFLTGKESGIAPARAVAESLDLGDAVIFLGFVEDVAPLYVAADVFVLPSCPEGWSMALLEAMAAGLPAVTTSEGGVPEPASPATAVLVGGEQIEELTLAILELTTGADRRAGLGRAAAARAGELDATVWTPRLEKLYADVIRVSEE